MPHMLTLRKRVSASGLTWPVQQFVKDVLLLLDRVGDDDPELVARVTGQVERLLEAGATGPAQLADMLDPPASGPVRHAASSRVHRTT